MPPRPYGDAKPHKQVGQQSCQGGDALARTHGVLWSPPTNWCVPLLLLATYAHTAVTAPLPSSSTTRDSSACPAAVTVWVPAAAAACPPGPFAFCLAALRQGFLVVVTGKLPPEQLDRFLELFRPLVSGSVLLAALKRRK